MSIITLLSIAVILLHELPLWIHACVSHLLNLICYYISNQFFIFYFRKTFDTRLSGTGHVVVFRHLLNHRNAQHPSHLYPHRFEDHPESFQLLWVLMKRMRTLYWDLLILILNICCDKWIYIEYTVWKIQGMVKLKSRLDSHCMTIIWKLAHYRIS